MCGCFFGARFVGSVFVVGCCFASCVGMVPSGFGDFEARGGRGLDPLVKDYFLFHCRFGERCCMGKGCSVGELFADGVTRGSKGFKGWVVVGHGVLVCSLACKERFCALSEADQVKKAEAIIERCSKRGATGVASTSAAIGLGEWLVCWLLLEWMCMLKRTACWGVWVVGLVVRCLKTGPLLSWCVVAV